MPKTDLQRMQVLRQGTEAAAGIARVQERYGIRFKVADEKALHEHFKPAAPFIAKADLKQLRVGPWPWRTRRQAIQKVFEAGGWDASPTQPLVGAFSGGQWWQVNASSRFFSWHSAAGDAAG